MTNAVLKNRTRYSKNGGQLEIKCIVPLNHQLKGFKILHCEKPTNYWFETLIKKKLGGGGGG